MQILPVADNLVYLDAVLFCQQIIKIKAFQTDSLNRFA